MIEIKSKREIELMREAGKVLAEVHERAGEKVKPGVSTGELNEYAEGIIRKYGCTPSFLHLYDFPYACCISVNDELIHGFPDFHRILKDGDIVSLDIGTNYHGYHSDATRTWCVGECSDNAKRIVEGAKDCFFAGIEKAVPGNYLNDICSTIGAKAEDLGYGVVKDYCGHGIGHEVHMDPDIVNYSMKRKGPKLCAGMTFAIEPMITEGSPDVHTLDNDWTVVTDDHKLCAHYENTILLTDNGPEILSLNV
jgi:methionyl aminopeptidase